MTERFREPSIEDLKDYFSEDWTHYTASIRPPRPGFAMFAATLEYQFFPPDTPENANYRILSTGWHHGSVWMTVSIPTSKKHLAEAVAKFAGLKILDTFPIANKDFAVFATLGMDNYNELVAADPAWDAFPLYKCTNLFSLENTDDHPTKTGKMNEVEWGEYELDVVGKIVGEHEWTEEDNKELEKFKKFMEGF